jgi:hypothetical protein
LEYSSLCFLKGVACENELIVNLNHVKYSDKFNMAASVTVTGLVSVLIFALPLIGKKIKFMNFSQILLNF